MGALLGRTRGLAQGPPLSPISPGRSRILPSPRAVIKMFAGLMSRWMMPFWCAASSPSAIWIANLSSSSTCRADPWVGLAGASPGPTTPVWERISAAIRSRSVCPSSNGITMKG